MYCMVDLVNDVTPKILRVAPDTFEKEAVYRVSGYPTTEHSLKNYLFRIKRARTNGNTIKVNIHLFGM